MGNWVQKTYLQGLVTTLLNLLITGDGAYLVAVGLCNFMFFPWRSSSIHWFLLLSHVGTSAGGDDEQVQVHISEKSWWLQTL